MDSKQKEVQQAHLDEEKRVIRKLKQVYKQASRDCEEKIQALASRTDMENLQSIIYQKQYQQALKTQIDGILDTLQTNEFDSVAEYLTTCYENGYVGTMYTLHGQGIPVITSIDQTQVVNAVQTESKLSENLYTRLGEDTGKLKKFIQSEMSRGIANGSTWLEVAKSIASGMNSPFKKAMNNAIRIARTEGGRIISQASLDAAYKARASGADSVKQWNATLDGRTRPDHRAADGQIRELDEYFTVGGEKMKAPLRWRLRPECVQLPVLHGHDPPVDAGRGRAATAERPGGVFRAGQDKGLRGVPGKVLESSCKNRGFWYNKIRGRL